MQNGVSIRLIYLMQEIIVQCVYKIIFIRLPSDSEIYHAFVVILIALYVLNNEMLSLSL